MFPVGSAPLQKATSLQKAAHGIGSGCAETALYSTASMLKQPLTAQHCCPVCVILFCYTDEEVKDKLRESWGEKEKEA